MMFFLKPPILAQKYFDQIIWKNKRDEIILTLDDGPHPIATKEVLEVLNKFGIKGIFFCLGKNLLSYPKLAEMISSEGHFIANHSFSHKKELFLCGRKTIIHEIESTQKEIHKNSNVLNLFRPPYGLFSGAILKACNELNLKVMMWSLLSGDYSKNENMVLRNLSRRVRKDSIIVFHDNERTANKISSILNSSIRLIKEKGHYFANTFDI